MSSQAARALLMAFGVSWLLAGCGTSTAQVRATAETSSPAVPPEVVEACGHPGAVVELKRVPLVVQHDRCDLTGVIVRFGGVGVTVPASGGAAAQGDGPQGGVSLTVQVAEGTGDVTISG